MKLILSLLCVLAISGVATHAAPKPNLVFFLADDLGEQTDLVAREPQRVSQLRDELHAWQKQVGATFPIPNSTYDPAKPSGRFAARPAGNATAPKAKKKE